MSPRACGRAGSEAADAAVIAGRSDACDAAGDERSPPKRKRLPVRLLVLEDVSDRTGLADFGIEAGILLPFMLPIGACG
jgi:hypothetical protein